MTSKGELIWSMVGVTVGTLACVGGFKIASDGIQEVEDTLYDFKADKFDVYEASGDAVIKTAAGMALVAAGATVATSSVALGFDAGQKSILEAAKDAAPVQIQANSLDAAQKCLDAMKALDGVTTE